MSAHRWYALPILMMLIVVAIAAASQSRAAPDSGMNRQSLPIVQRAPNPTATPTPLPEPPDPAFLREYVGLFWRRDAASSFYSLYAMRGDGSALVRLTPFDIANGAVSAAWSPDNRTVAFSYENGPEPRRLYLVDRDGANLRLLNTPPIYEVISWSPDGSRLLVRAAGQTFGSRLLVVNPAANSYTSGFDHDWTSSHEWFPDGSRIIYTVHTNAPPGGSWGKLAVYSMAADATDARLLTQGDDADNFVLKGLLANGSRFAAFEWSHITGNTGTFLYDSDGGNKTPLLPDNAEMLGITPDQHHFIYRSDAVYRQSIPPAAPLPIGATFIPDDAPDGAAWVFHKPRWSPGAQRVVVPAHLEHLYGATLYSYHAWVFPFDPNAETATALLPTQLRTPFWLDDRYLIAARIVDDPEIYGEVAGYPVWIDAASGAQAPLLPDANAADTWTFIEWRHMP